MIRRIPMVALVAAAWVATATPLRGQACLGYPQGTTGSLAAEFLFPEGATGYSLVGMAASRGGGTYFQGGFGIVDHDDDRIENSKSVQGGVAYEVQALAPDASVCPQAAAAYSWLGDLNLWSIPFGVGFGSTFALGPDGGAGLTPFAVPQFLYLRSSLDDVEDSAVSDVYVALLAGATLNVGAFTLTGSVSKIFEEGEDAVFGLRVGAAW